ncbi:MAG: translation elongation factor Ts [Patescibacteria group bacterium]
MSEISLEQVKELRNKTGVSIMQCKKALEESEGDMERALIHLTKKSGEIAAKKGDRELHAGTIASHNGVMVELACETDFVSNNEEFRAYATKIAELISQEADKDALKVLTDEATQKFGERVEITRYQSHSDQAGVYVHSNYSVGAIVEFQGNAGELARNIAMHIAAQNPRYLTREDIPAEEMDKARAVLMEEVADKPADMQEKILEGKINAYFKERVLLEQSYIMDPSQTVAQILPDGVSITSYTRFGVGEA